MGSAFCLHKLYYDRPVRLWKLIKIIALFSDDHKPINEYSEEDKKLFSMNAKDMNILYCVLEINEFNRISICLSAHDISHLLEATHESTNKVKELKIKMLIYSYELFKMNIDEYVTEMITKFAGIINELNVLDRIYSNFDLVKTLLWSLLKN